MKTVIRIGNQVKPTQGLEKISGMEIDAKVELIQSLIPLELMHVEEELKEEVERLVGPRHSRRIGHPGHVRWGRQRGSVFLLEQKVPVDVPRVRDRARGAEVPLSFYRSMQTPRGADEGLLLRVLRGISCRSYKTAAEAIPEALGMAPSSVSRRFIAVSARQLRELSERDISGYDFVALVLDGKAFGKSCEMVTALGITLDGKKIVPGLCRDRHGERGGVDGVPARACGPGSFLRERSVGGPRRGQGGSEDPGPGLFPGARWCNAASGTSGRTSSATSRRNSGRRFGDDCSTPTTAPLWRRPRQRCSG